jgi:hypothetical protein
MLISEIMLVSSYPICLKQVEMLKDKSVKENLESVITFGNSTEN